MAWVRLGASLFSAATSGSVGRSGSHDEKRRVWPGVFHVSRGGFCLCCGREAAVVPVRSISLNARFSLFVIWLQGFRLEMEMGCPQIDIVLFYGDKIEIQPGRRRNSTMAQCLCNLH
jgi:hypothetical protein